MMSLTIFTATWCGPCKQIKTWLESNGDLDKFHFVDIDNPDGTIPLGVKSVPTLIDTEHEKIISGANSIIDYLKDSRL
jgi:thiol-disulfide isomerase/thioredoxin